MVQVSAPTATTTARRTKTIVFARLREFMSAVDQVTIQSNRRSGALLKVLI
jgi:hypothetical protein